MTSLNESLMLVNLSIRGWTARKLDKRVTQETNDQHGADQQAGRYNKSLVARDALKAWVQATGNARTFHYHMTAPWSDQGRRVLPTALYFDYVTRMGELEREAQAAVVAFCMAYPQLVEDARAILGSMWSAEDYPALHTVRGKFHFSWSLEPLPQAGHLVTNLVAEEEARLRADLDQRVSEALDAATRDCFRRLYDSVNAIRVKMSEEGKGKGGTPIFRDSLIGNLRELVDLLPRLNPTKDPALDHMVDEARKHLAGVEPSDLRDYPAARTQAAQAADDICRKMAAFM